MLITKRHCFSDSHIVAVFARARTISSYRSKPSAYPRSLTTFYLISTKNLRLFHSLDFFQGKPTAPMLITKRPCFSDSHIVAVFARARTISSYRSMPSAYPRSLTTFYLLPSPFLINSLERFRCRLHTRKQNRKGV